LNFFKRNYHVFLETFLIAAVFVIIAMFFSGGGLRPVVYVDAVFVVGAYVYLRARFLSHMRKRVGVMAKDMRAALLGGSGRKAAGGPAERERTGDAEVDRDLRPFYEELDAVLRELRKDDADRQEILDMINSIAVNMDFDKVLEDLMPRLIEVTNSGCCAFYSLNGSTNKLEIKNSAGFSKNVYSEFDMTLGEGYVGMAAESRKTVVIKDIPDDTVYSMRTFLGKVKPKSLLVVPILNNDQFIGVLVFASIYDYSAKELEMIEIIRYYVGVAAANGMTYEKTKRLSNELKFQNKLIQNLNEELEQKVESRSLYLTNIIDRVADCAIYTMDRQGIILTWSKGAEELIGFTAEEAVGRHVENIYEPEDREAARNRLDTALNAGSCAESGWRALKDGSRRFFEIRLFSIYNDQNEVIGVSNITRDLTALKLAQNAAAFEKETGALMIEGRETALVLADAGGAVISASRGAALRLDEELLTGRNICNFFEESIELSGALESMSPYPDMYERTFTKRGGNARARVWMTAVENALTGEKRVLLEIGEGE